MSGELSCLCSADSSLDILVVFFFLLLLFLLLRCSQTTFSIPVARSIYGGTVCMMLCLRHRPSTSQCTAQQRRCFFLHILHLSAWLCETETNTQAEAFRFLLVICLPTFSAVACSSASVLSFGLNSPSVEGQALETTDDFVAIEGRLIFPLIIDS